jgi:hypothetical protein
MAPSSITRSALVAAAAGVLLFALPSASQDTGAFPWQYSLNIILNQADVSHEISDISVSRYDGGRTIFVADKLNHVVYHVLLRWDVYRSIDSRCVWAEGGGFELLLMWGLLYLGLSLRTRCHPYPLLTARAPKLGIRCSTV